MTATTMHHPAPPFNLAQIAQLEAIQLSKVALDTIEAEADNIARFEELCTRLHERGCAIKPRLAQLGKIALYHIHMVAAGAQEVQHMMLAMEELDCNITDHQQHRMAHFTEDEYHVAAKDAPHFTLYITRCHGGMQA